MSLDKKGKTEAGSTEKVVAAFQKCGEIEGETDEDAFKKISETCKIDLEDVKNLLIGLIACNRVLKMDFVKSDLTTGISRCGVSFRLNTSNTRYARNPRGETNAFFSEKPRWTGVPRRLQDIPSSIGGRWVRGKLKAVEPHNYRRSYQDKSE